MHTPVQAHSLLFAPQRPVKNSWLPEQVVHSGQSVVAKQSVQVSQQPQPEWLWQLEQLLQPQPEWLWQLEQLFRAFQLFQLPQPVQRFNTELHRFRDLSAP